MAVVDILDKLIKLKTIINEVYPQNPPESMISCQQLIETFESLNKNQITEPEITSFYERNRETFKSATNELISKCKKENSDTLKKLNSIYDFLISNSVKSKKSTRKVIVADAPQETIKPVINTSDPVRKLEHLKQSERQLLEEIQARVQTFQLLIDEYKKYDISQVKSQVIIAYHAAEIADLEHEFLDKKPKLAKLEKKVAQHKSEYDEEKIKSNIQQLELYKNELIPLMNKFFDAYDLLIKKLNEIKNLAHLTSALTALNTLDVKDLLVQKNQKFDKAEIQELFNLNLKKAELRFVLAKLLEDINILISYPGFTNAEKLNFEKMFTKTLEIFNNGLLAMEHTHEKTLGKHSFAYPTFPLESQKLTAEIFNREELIQNLNELHKDLINLKNKREPERLQAIKERNLAIEDVLALLSKLYPIVEEGMLAYDANIATIDFQLRQLKNSKEIPTSQDFEFIQNSRNIILKDYKQIIGDINNLTRTYNSQLQPFFDAIKTLEKSELQQKILNYVKGLKINVRTFNFETPDIGLLELKFYKESLQEKLQKLPQAKTLIENGIRQAQLQDEIAATLLKIQTFELNRHYYSYHEKNCAKENALWKIKERVQQAKDINELQAIVLPIEESLKNFYKEYKKDIANLESTILCINASLNKLPDNLRPEPIDINAIDFSNSKNVPTLNSFYTLDLSVITSLQVLIKEKEVEVEKIKRAKSLADEISRQIDNFLVAITAYADEAGEDLTNYLKDVKELVRKSLLTIKTSSANKKELIERDIQNKEKIQNELSPYRQYFNYVNYLNTNKQQFFTNFLAINRLLNIDPGIMQELNHNHENLLNNYDLVIQQILAKLYKAPREALDPSLEKETQLLSKNYMALEISFAKVSASLRQNLKELKRQIKEYGGLAKVSTPFNDYLKSLETNIQALNNKLKYIESLFSNEPNAITTFSKFNEKISDFAEKAKVIEKEIDKSTKELNEQAAKNSQLILAPRETAEETKSMKKAINIIKEEMRRIGEDRDDDRFTLLNEMHTALIDLVEGDKGYLRNYALSQKDFVLKSIPIIQNYLPRLCQLTDLRLKKDIDESTSFFKILIAEFHLLLLRVFGRSTLLIDRSEVKLRKTYTDACSTLNKIQKTIAQHTEATPENEASENSDPNYTQMRSELLGL